MSRVFRFVPYTITQDEAVCPEYIAECVAGDEEECGAHSGRFVDRGDVEAWMFGHARDSGHRPFRRTFTDFADVGQDQAGEEGRDRGERAGGVTIAHGFPVTAYVLIMDRLGRMLLVHPAKAGGPWHLPGGIVEPGESPLDAVRREVREELGLTFDTHIWQFLAVEWLQAARPERRDRLSFLFTGPRLYSGDDGRIVLQREELDAWRWEYTGSALELLHPRLSARVARALRTHRAHPVSYLEARNEEATP
ncbi:NUDIX domain-containing protein [Streptomyces sp. NRRL B-1677]|uniref:NUDIX domain-containing protein n=1 Tax=Streptomyces sp. NRRL B-1677 TaxID=2682966 RepID=UPI0018928CE0|nr:NUDIX hydrolase [Streptomyces sp. NRRL B-1677]